MYSLSFAERGLPREETRTGPGTMSIKPRLLSFLQGSRPGLAERVPIVEDVRVYVRRYAAASSLAAQDLSVGFAYADELRGAYCSRRRRGRTGIEALGETCTRAR